MAMSAGPMFLLCTVRGCGLPLSHEGAALRCARNHSFDRAREGYWNLLQPHDRRSARPGDRPAAVEARRRWLESGFADSFGRELVALLRGIAGLSAVPADEPQGSRPFVVLDAGCGEGTLGACLFSGGAASGAARTLADSGISTSAGGAGRPVALHGIDISVGAIRLAARSFPWATWIVANVDRGVPLADRSCDLVLSLFGRRNPSEFRRVLRPGGHALVAIPGEDDLHELREAVQGWAASRERAGAVVADFVGGASSRPSDPPRAGWEFSLAARRDWRSRILLDPPSIRDLLAITYRGSRHSERARVETIGSLEVTLSANLLAFTTPSDETE